MKQTRAASFDAVQFRVHFVGTIERNIQHYLVRQRVEGDRGEAGLDDDLTALVPGGDEADFVVKGMTGVVDGGASARAVDEGNAVFRGRGAAFFDSNSRVAVGDFAGRLDCFDDVEDCCAGADTDVLEIG